MPLCPVVLASRSRLTLSPPLLSLDGVLLPRLPFPLSATPSRPCYQWLELQFAVGDNFSTGHSRFLYFLHSLLRLPNQTRTQLQLVSMVIESTPPLLPQGLVLFLSYSSNSTPSAVTLLPLCLTLRFLHSHASRLCSVLSLHYLSGGCQRLGF